MLTQQSRYHLPKDNCEIPVVKDLTVFQIVNSFSSFHSIMILIHFFLLFIWHTYVNLRITCVKNSRKEETNSPKWEALIGSFATCDPNEGSNPSSGQIHYTKDDLQHHWASTKTFGGGLEVQSSSHSISKKSNQFKKVNKRLNEIYPADKLKKMNRQYYLNSKNTPKKLKNVRLRDRIRYYRRKAKLAKKIENLSQTEKKLAIQKKKKKIHTKNKDYITKLKARKVSEEKDHQ